MRHLTAISAFALLMAVPVWAQHGGGGHGGGGGHSGGFGGGHSSGVSGSHGSGFSGGHGGGSVARASSGPIASGGFSGSRYSNPGVSRAFTRPPSAAQRSFSRSSAYNGNRGNRYRAFGFSNYCYGSRCWGRYGYPWAYAYYDPWWWWDNSSGTPDYQDQAALAQQMDQQSLEEQRMRDQEEADGDQDAYAQPPMRPGEPESDTPQTNTLQPPTVLIFRDQHKLEVANYAIVGQTLWNFTPHRTERIPLADLDLTATAEVNDEHGITFRLPSSVEAQ